MRHDLVEAPLPLAGGPGTRAGVRSELTGFFMLRFLRVHESNCAACVGVFAREHHITGDFFHSEVADVAEGAAARGAAGQLGAAARADEVPALALQDGWQHIVEAHWALE